jgi:hypothetical protein
VKEPTNGQSRNEKLAGLLFEALPMVAKDKKGRWYCVFKKGNSVGVSYFVTPHSAQKRHLVLDQSTVRESWR